MNLVLVINSGSSSVKYRLFDGDDTVTHGTVERIGEPGSPVANHTEAVGEILGKLNLDEVTAIGHRVVHGGLRFTRPTLVDDEVEAAIESLAPLAPLHNPANLAGITAARRLRPDVPQVVVFDTAFHRTVPRAAATYAIDVKVAAEHAVHRYGFHGTSHAYVSRRTALLLDQDLAETNVITLHLGNGASACAVGGGRSMATSMGLTPLEGLVMGTRCGDIDPAAVFHLHRTAGLSLDEIDDLLNHRSGMRGLAGSNDMREVEAARKQGDESATLAFDVYCHRIKFYVGAYYALLGRVDAVTFTAGIGENSPEVRATALAGLERLGIVVDEARNTAQVRGERTISPDGTAVPVWVVPTDEELEIAGQTRMVVSQLQ